ncbi:MAG: EAL domain-containing protein [Labilithrix sp.]|nr:EAL domain-containing protein [Labilithrix sp.]
MSDRARPIVLLVDDDPMMRLLTAEALFGAGYDVVEAADGSEAVDRFGELAPDVVLLDVVMPEMDGYDVCRVLRGLPGGAATPILMMTGLDDVDSIHRAYEAGATDFITKPINYSLLGYRLRYLLRAAATFRESCETAARLARAQRLARIAHWELDLQTGHYHHPRAGLEILGLSPAERDASTFGLAPAIHPDDRDRVEVALAGREAHQIEYRVVLPDGTEKYLHQEAELVDDELTGRARLVGTAQDVTVLRKAERQVLELAYFDSLTGLPNRTFLRQYLARVLGNAERDGKNLAILALDLDLFKRVNDTLGHAAGDALLREVAARVTSCIREGDMVASAGGNALERALTSDSVAARLGGDEFVVVLGGIRRPEDAAVVARRIADRLAMGFTLGTAEVFVSSSIGIATFPENGRDAASLLECADAAMYHAKDSGRNGFQFFTPSIHEAAKRRVELENTLRSALARSGILGGHGESHRGGSSTRALSEFELHYQPKVEIPSGRVSGAEALLRWTSPERGCVSPAEFVPIAEDTGLIVPLGEWVLRTACRQAKEWEATAPTPLRVAVNVSARQFREPGFCALVADVLRETGLAPNLLELEITEGMVMQDTATSGEVLLALKQLGVRIALDDFGTGYSSLSYLTKLPIDALKIDRSFITNLGSAAKSETITAAIIGLSRGLDIDVVVEGVETEAQLDFLGQYGNAEIQGYFFAKPMPVAEVVAWCGVREARLAESSVARPTEQETVAPQPSGSGLYRAVKVRTGT